MTENINLWHIACYEDLLHFIRKSKGNNHLMIAITLTNTPENIKKIIRKFLKSKSKLFPNIMFLYYCALNDDLGKIKTIIPLEKDGYPWVHSIYNFNNLIGTVNNVEDITTLNNFFEQIEDDYKNYSERSNNASQNNNIDNNYFEDQNSHNDNQKIDTLENQNQNNNIVSTNFVQNENEIKELEKIEKKKNLDKICALQEFVNENQLNFFKEIQKRKKKEEDEIELLKNK
jgi:hypothetical protein